MAFKRTLLFGAIWPIIFILGVELVRGNPTSLSMMEPPDAVPLIAPDPLPRTQYCEYYNSSSCLGNSTNCYEREECDAQDPDKRHHCYVVWTKDNVTGQNIITLKGCFLDSGGCYKTDCVEESFRPKGVHFCCCNGNMCNQNFTLNPIPTEPTVKKVNEEETEEEHLLIPIICVVCGLIISSIAVGIWWFARIKSNRFNELPTVEPSCPPSPEGNEDWKNLLVVLEEVIARGRFGAVWRAQLNNQVVAVKIFPAQDKPSWVTELEIFKLPRMNHADILQFIDKKMDNVRGEYWLVTAYHEKGSLCDYLKGHTLTWAEAWKIAHTMARGLTHLHDEVAAATLGKNTKWDRKPAIAHRDFKSKNVLLKNDMSACIADFGLALIFTPGKPCGNTHGQVGTRRYMAPEVLEGAINFTRDAFLRIDMYACGLVLWEIASRCTTCGNVSEYMLPFEEEVGAHPTLEEMQEAVVLRKLRPAIPQSWKDHNAMSLICDTMEECWDHDAEARLSASCVMERIGALGQLSTRQQHQHLLIENACLFRDD